MRISAAFLILLSVVLLLGPILAPVGYAAQDREHVLAAPGAEHWLGTDHLGRDNFARYLHGGRLSMILSALAAAGACVISALLGTAAAMGGAESRACSSTVFDIMLSTPWYLLVFCLRAALPIDSPALVTAAVTFGILALVGWAPGARTIRGAVLKMRSETWVIQARAGGFAGFGLLIGHIAPNLRPLLRTQFFLLLPTLLLSEATLGMLGLGIPEPLPSWGGSLLELTEFGAALARPWTMTPALLLALTSLSLRALAELDQHRGPIRNRKELIWG